MSARETIENLWSRATPIVPLLDAVEREIREQIAKEIEAVDPVDWALAGQHAGKDAAAIARRSTR